MSYTHFPYLFYSGVCHKKMSTFSWSDHTSTIEDCPCFLFKLRHRGLASSTGAGNNSPELVACLRIETAPSTAQK